MARVAAAVECGRRRSHAGWGAAWCVARCHSTRPMALPGAARYLRQCCHIQHCHCPIHGALLHGGVHRSIRPRPRSPLAARLVQARFSHNGGYSSSYSTFLSGWPSGASCAASSRSSTSRRRRPPRSTKRVAGVTRPPPRLLAMRQRVGKGRARRLLSVEGMRQPVSLCLVGSLRRCRGLE